MNTGESRLNPNEQCRQIAPLWGIDEKHYPDISALNQELAQRMSDPLAARFVWEQLEDRERLILWSCLGKQARKRRPQETIFVQTHPQETVFGGTVTSLIEKGLITSSDVFLCACEESAEALYRTGRELFFAGAARTRYALDKLLPSSLDQVALFRLLHQYRLAPQAISSLADLRKALAAALADPAIVNAALPSIGQQEPLVQPVVFWLDEQGGCVSLQALREHFGLNDERVFSLLHQLEDAGIAFDTLSPEGAIRLLFLPQARRSHQTPLPTCSRTSGSPKTLLADTQTPTTLAEGLPQVVFDLVAALNAVFQRRVDLKLDLGVAAWCVKQIRPCLREGRSERETDTGSSYLDLLFRAAYHLQLIERQEPPYTGSGLRASYVPGSGIKDWAIKNQIEQIRELLTAWVAGKIWKDLLRLDFSQWDWVSWRPELGRPFLLSMLSECGAETWYNIDAFLMEIWKREPYIMRPAIAVKAAGLHPTEVLREHWWRADGAFLRGILCSTLWEFGLISLGTEKDVLPSEVPAQATSFQLTELGIQVLHNATLPESSLFSENRPRLLVGANYEVHLLGEDLSALYTLIPWTEVIQIGKVSRLRLSAHSLQRALSHGLQGTDLLQFLATRTTSELPPNVVYSLQEWARNYQTVQITQGVVLIASSEKAARHLEHTSAFRGLLQAAPRVFLAPIHTDIADLRRLLEKEQIVVQLVSSISLPPEEGSNPEHDPCPEATCDSFPLQHSRPVHTQAGEDLCGKLPDSQ